MEPWIEVKFLYNDGHSYFVLITGLPTVLADYVTFIYLIPSPHFQLKLCFQSTHINSKEYGQVRRKKWEWLLHKN